MEYVYLALGIVIALGAGLAVGYVVRGYWGSQAVKHAQEKAGRIIAEAQARQKDLILQGKEEQVRLQREAEDDARAKRAEISGFENRLLQRDAQLDERSEMLEARDRKLLDRERELDLHREELSRAK
jgi:ribonuclease Y